MYRVADLSNEDEMRIKQLEKELGVTLIAYNENEDLTGHDVLTNNEEK